MDERRDESQDDEQVPSKTPYEPPVAEAVEGPDPDSVAPGMTGAG